jgi:hypothetical protein
MDGKFLPARMPALLIPNRFPLEPGRAMADNRGSDSLFDGLKTMFQRAVRVPQE